MRTCLKKHQTLFDKIIKMYKFDVNEQEDQRAAAEELITHIAQTDPKATIVRRFIAAIRKILRRIGIVKEWSDNDIIALIAEAQGSYGRRGNLDQIVFSEDVMVEETGEVFTVEENAAELLNQQDKRIGVVEKLKQCL